MRRSSVRGLKLALFMAVFAGLSGCSQTPPPDKEMLSSASGLWIGQKDSGVSIDIQDGGTLKITRGGKEQSGTWKQNGANAITATIDGQTYEMPYKRQDLNFSITLPGESAPTDFSQM